MVKNSEITHPLRSVVSRILLVGISFIPVPAAISAEIDWRPGTYSHFSNNESLGSVIESLLATQGIPVRVSDKITQKVSLRQVDVQPRDMFYNLVKTYQLNWFYDGQLLFVYHGDDVLTATLKLNHLSIPEFMMSARKLNLLDSRFPWTTSNKEQLIYFSGPEEYIDKVFELARAIDNTEKSRSTGVAYRWKDKSGRINLSSFPPEDTGTEFATIDLNSFYSDR